MRGIGQSEQLHVVERFTIVDANTINYEATIDDPQTYTRPWKVAMPINRDSKYEIFEYACHEGNYALPDRSGVLAFRKRRLRQPLRS